MEEGRSGTIMRRAALLMAGLISLIIVVGAFVRIAVLHGDASSLSNFLTASLVPGVPAIAGWWHARKSQVAANVAASNASDAVTSAEKAANTAGDARDAAQEAAHNTNGKLDIGLTAIKTQVSELANRFDQHLAYHGEKDA